ncbi:MAG: lexA [Chlamydiia bacterium]|nr:lexA [Chlamydiia bacterium]
MKNLTKRQAEILTYISTFFLSHGYSPSCRELMQAFGFASVASAFKHMKSLESKGYLQKIDQKWRSLQPVEEPSTESKIQKEERIGKRVPIIGALAKGKKMELFAKMEETLAPSSLIKTELPCYGFLIKDDSFLEEHIRQDDLIIIEVRDTAKAGEIIVVTNPEQVVTICNFSKEQESEHIHGVLIALLRSYEISSSSDSGSKSSRA